MLDNFTNEEKAVVLIISYYLFMTIKLLSK